MSWFEKIKSLTTKPDNSPELKRGEVKGILLTEVKKALPEFEFLAYRNNGYTFQNIKEVEGIKVYETIHVAHTLKDRMFACSVASMLNPEYTYSSSYNTCLINPHIDLKVLKKGSGAIPVEEAYYFHNGRVATTTKVIEEIFADFKKYGIPFLEQQLDQIESSPTIRAGISFINNLSVDKEELQRSITESMVQGRLSAIRNNTYDELKQTLYSTLNGNGRMKEVRNKIPKSAFELLELYWKD